MSSMPCTTLRKASSLVKLKRRDRLLRKVGLLPRTLRIGQQLSTCFPRLTGTTPYSVIGRNSQQNHAAHFQNGVQHGADRTVAHDCVLPQIAT